MLDLITDFKINIIKKGVNNLTNHDEKLLRFYDRLYNLVQKKG